MEQPPQAEPEPKGTEAWAEQHSGVNAPSAAGSEATTQDDAASEASQPVGVPQQHNAEAEGSLKLDADAVMGYDQQIAALRDAAKKYKPETEEERKKRERRERSKRIVAAVGDGLMALSNLYFTTRGAPNMYDHKTMSQQTPLQTQLDKLKAEREANADKYLLYSLKIGDAENGRAKTLRELEQQQEQMRLAREKAQREQEAHDWLAALQDDKKREQAGKATKAEQEAATAKAEADNAPDLYKEKVITERNRGKAAAASAVASWASAADHYASANEHNTNAKGRFEWWDKDGNVHYAKTQDEAIMKARQHGTLDSAKVITTDSTDSDVVNSGKVVRKVVGKDKDGNPIYGEPVKRNTKKTTSKTVYYPGIRKKPAAQPTPRPASKPSGGKGGKWASGLKL